jgi:hypothetical protein
MLVNAIAAKYSGDGAKPGVLTICGEHERSVRGAPEIAKDVRGAIPEVRGASRRVREGASAELRLRRGVGEIRSKSRKFASN